MAVQRKFYLFFFLSALLHAGLGQLLSGVDSRSVAGSTITVSLLPPSSQHIASIASRQATGGETTPQMSDLAFQNSAGLGLYSKTGDLYPSQAGYQIQRSAVVAQGANKHSDAGTPQPGRTQALVTGNILKRMLQNNMAQFFHYPRFALKRGWQGQVTIGIRIEADGYISRTQLVNSSGYSALDVAAMEGARKVKSLPNAVALLNGQAFDLQLPVIYRLQGG